MRWIVLLPLAACASTPCPDSSAEPSTAESSSGGEAHAHHGRHEGHHHGEGMQHDFSDVARFEAMFDAPGRARWQRPVEVVGLLDLTPGETVADLGAGTGYFEPLLAAAVGPRGRVLALDSEPAMVAHLRERAQAEGLTVVEAREVAVDGPGLEPGSVDAILVVDTWHHLPDRVAYATKLRDALRDGGVLLVVDFTLQTEQGPPVSARIAPDALVEELRAAGLQATLVDETLPDQYVVRATR
ncbi:MAG: class I SAM-dependent methyltransferase [Sandaracinus sp.]|nr:class I SAM-dependent methyltransferase [Sandaracinus sp.]MCB9624545.1 class I SAM-dependent methyltransferase [Sandaracinus sp.]